VRTTADFAVMSQWVDAPRAARLAYPESLTAARCEPVLRGSIGASALDLFFESGGEFAVIANILIDPMVLINRLGPALLWPKRVAATLSSAHADAIEERLTPWLRTLALGRMMAGEHVRRYAPSAAFDRARADGLCGAAPFATTVVRMAPFVYARRLAYGKHVRLACADAALGAALLAGVAASVGIDDLDDAGRFALTWYGVAPGHTAESPGLEIVDRPDRRTDAATTILLAEPDDSFRGVRVPIPQPVPHDVLFTFEEADAPAVGSLSVDIREKSAARPRRAFSGVTIAPGSSGSITIWLSPDTELGDDDAVDEAHELARRLRAEGLSVDVTSRFDPAHASEAGLVHVFGRFDRELAARAAELGARRIPFVVSIAPIGAQTLWGEMTMQLIAQVAIDQAAFERFAAAYEKQSLIPDDVTPQLSPAADAELRAEIEQALLPAQAIFVTTDAEAAAVAELCPRLSRERIIAAGIILGPEPEDAATIDHLIPARPFALVHAPALRSSNTLLPLYALAEANVPVVVAGGSGDVLYLAMMRRIAGPDAVFITDPPPAVVTALYRRAKAIVEPSRRPAGLARLARGVASGALPVVASDSAFAALMSDRNGCFDPLSFRGIAATIVAALEATDSESRRSGVALRLSDLTDPGRTTASILRGYLMAVDAITA
jgi:hypothetical protein